MYSNNERYLSVSSTQVHDLKNRLTVIKGVAQLLGRQVQRADWEQGRIIERVDSLQSEIVRLEGMINGLSATGQQQGFNGLQGSSNPYTDG